jgi:hypothetical protein
LGVFDAIDDNEGSDGNDGNDGTEGSDGLGIDSLFRSPIRLTLATRPRTAPPRPTVSRP